MCLQRLEKTLSSTKNRALLHIAKLEEACMSPRSPEPHLPLLPYLVLELRGERQDGIPLLSERI